MGSSICLSFKNSFPMFHGKKKQHVYNIAYIYIYHIHHSWILGVLYQTSTINIIFANLFSGKTKTKEMTFCNLNTFYWNDCFFFPRSTSYIIVLFSTYAYVSSVWSVIVVSSFLAKKQNWYTPENQHDNWKPWKINRLNMYILLKIVIFHGHVSLFFLGGGKIEEE